MPRTTPKAPLPAGTVCNVIVPGYHTVGCIVVGTMPDGSVAVKVTQPHQTITRGTILYVWRRNVRPVLHGPYPVAAGRA